MPQRWKETVTRYRGVPDFNVAVEGLDLSGVEVSLENGPAVFFQFRDLDKTGKAPLPLPTIQARCIFGKRYQNIPEGKLDFPLFEMVEFDVLQLFNDVNSKKVLQTINVGENLLKMAGRCRKWFEDQREVSELYDGVPDFLLYKKFIADDRHSDGMIRFIKVVNTRIIIWVFGAGSGTRLCDCGLMPALFQNNTTREYFYGCERWLSRQEKPCDYSKDFWVSRYKLETDETC